MTDSLTHEFDALGHQLFNRAISCARQTPAGLWEIDVSRPHDDEATHKAFLLALLRAELAPPEIAERNGLIDQAMADTSTIPLESSE